MKCRSLARRIGMKDMDLGGNGCWKIFDENHFDAHSFAASHFAVALLFASTWVRRHGIDQTRKFSSAQIKALSSRGWRRYPNAMSVCIFHRIHNLQSVSLLSWHITLCTHINHARTWNRWIHFEHTHTHRAVDADAGALDEDDSQKRKKKSSAKNKRAIRVLTKRSSRLSHRCLSV